MHVARWVYDPVEMVVDPKLNLLDYLIAPARVNERVGSGAEHQKRRLILQHRDCLVSIVLPILGLL